MDGTLLVEMARAFAIERHAGHTRPNKKQDPIWMHLEEVARLVEHSGGSYEEVAAAWLHDSVEDTETTLEEIKEIFGPEVAELVDGLTDPPEFANLPLLERKLKQAERIRCKSPGVKRIKKSDQTSNTYLVTRDPPLDWDYQKCTDYVKGAAAIAKECNGVSGFLDMVFELAYRDALRIYPRAV